jgi:5-bromo-4-chloroindolyl phosphate hydrolysis protein
MEQRAREDRRERAARNQSLFRHLNERLREAEEALTSVSGKFVIACECADTSCIEMLNIDPNDYKTIRADPRWFIVLAGHIYTDVERVVRQTDGYVVVEKLGTAGEVAEAEAEADSTDDQLGGP